MSKLRKRLTKEPETADDQPRRVAWRRWIPALAATLTLVVVGIYFVSQPDWSGGNRPVTTLDRSISFRGSAPELANVPLSHDLVLPTPLDESLEEYRVEFRNLSTGRVTEVPGLKEDHPSEVLIKGPQRLEPGEYEISLLGIRNGGEEIVGTYRVRLLGP